MMIKFNPKEPTYFASASTDTTIKLWNITKVNSNITLKGHVSGVNGIAFCGSDQPYIASASDDKTVKIWDTQQRKCMYTLDEHTDTVLQVVYHPDMPYLLTASEDGNVIIWNTNTWQSMNTINYCKQFFWKFGDFIFFKLTVFRFVEVLDIGNWSK